MSSFHRQTRFYLTAFGDVSTNGKAPKLCNEILKNKKVLLTFFLHRKAVVCCVISLSIVFTGTRYENIEFWYYNDTLYIPVDSSSIQDESSVMKVYINIQLYVPRRTVNFKIWGRTYPIGQHGQQKRCNPIFYYWWFIRDIYLLTN